jgi:hypothetical protein
MRWLVLVALWCNIATAQVVVQHNISDDGYVRVPLQFSFPYYGRVFTESYMFSNGVVGFLNPSNSWCCTGFDLRTNNGTPFSFAIMPLQTDLLNYSGRFLTEGTPQYQRYKWENISEFGVPENLNTFGVEIRPSGYIGMHYEKVNISPSRPVTIGMTGDVGEYTQFYHGAGFSQTNFNHITESTGNQCLVNPLFSPSCSGYQEAYLAQQCSASSLYSPQCPNYAQAYQDQQCSIDPLYSTSCQGYEQAYFNNQCSINALFNSQCQGYEQAYLTQQCNISQLYSASCSGYQAAYFAQQCALNGLYDSQCPNYAEAYTLTNIVTPNRPVAIPQVQISTTGTVSVETPIVADRVVNEVITRTSQMTSQSNVAQTQQVQSPQAEKPKETAKSETKQETKQDRKQAPKQVANIEVPTIATPVIKVEQVQILDLLSKKMISKPIKSSDRDFYLMMVGTHKLHEDMIDGQYGKGN